MNYAVHVPSLRVVMSVLVLLFAGCRTGVLPDERAPNHYPEFSWDRLPLYTHIRKVAAFTPEELNYLATFPLITFEKTTGVHTYGSTDAGTIEAARAVKKINPKARTLFYRNVIVHYGGYSFDEGLENIDAPFLVNKAGEDKVIRNSLHAYDLSNPQLVDWWVEGASAICSDPAIDGLFLDGNIKVLTGYLGRITPNSEVEAAFRVGYSDMLTRTKEELGQNKLMIANIIRAMLPDSGLEALEYFDGSYLEGFTLPVGAGSADYIVKGIEAVQTAARQGKIIAMTLGLGESAADEDKVDDARAKLDGLSGLQKRINYYIALFLVCAEKYSYLNLHDGYCVDTHNGRCMSKVWLKRFPEYDRPLGPPKGPAKRDGYVFTREFEHVSVRVDVESQEGEVVWHE